MIIERKCAVNKNPLVGLLSSRYQKVLNDTSIRLRDLLPYANYTFYVRTTRDGSHSFSEPSNVVTVRTKPGGMYNVLKLQRK